MGRIVFGDSFIGGFRGNCSCLASRSYALLGYELFFKFLLSSLIPASNSDPYLYVRRISDHSGSCSHVWSLHLIPSSVSLAMGRHILPDLEGDVNHTLLHSPVRTFQIPRDYLGNERPARREVFFCLPPCYCCPAQQHSADRNLWRPDQKEKEKGLGSRLGPDRARWRALTSEYKGTVASQ